MSGRVKVYISLMLFTQHLLGTCCMPGHRLGTGDVAANETDLGPCAVRSLVEETDRQVTEEAGHITWP